MTGLVPSKISEDLNSLVALGAPPPLSLDPLVSSKSHSVTHDLGQDGSCLEGTLPILGSVGGSPHCLITTHIFPQKIGLPAKHRTKLNSAPQANRGKTLYLCALYILRVYLHVCVCAGGAF